MLPAPSAGSRAGGPPFRFRLGASSGFCHDWQCLSGFAVKSLDCGVPRPSRSLRTAGTTDAYATWLVRKGQKVASAVQVGGGQVADPFGFGFALKAHDGGGAPSFAAEGVKSCVGSIATRPFDSAQGRLLRTTPGRGTHCSGTGRKTREAGPPAQAQQLSVASSFFVSSRPS